MLLLSPICCLIFRIVQFLKNEATALVRNFPAISKVCAKYFRGKWYFNGKSKSLFCNLILFNFSELFCLQYLVLDNFQSFPACQKPLPWSLSLPCSFFFFYSSPYHQKSTSGTKGVRMTHCEIDVKMHLIQFPLSVTFSLLNFA